MKMKKRNFIIKICSLLLFGIISITLLGSWTYNPSTDTITSDNLLGFDNDNVSINGIDITINNGVFTFNGTTTSNTQLYIRLKNSIPIGQYTYNQFSKISGHNVYLTTSNNTTNDLVINIGNTSGLNNTFTTTSVNNYLYIYILSGINFNNYIFTPMLTNGHNNIVTPFEPFGTYVNQQRLDDLELDYDELAEQYSNLYDDYETLQNSYNAVESAYNQLESDFNTLESNYNDLNSRYSTLVDEYDSLLEEKQDLQQQLADLNNELALLRPYIFNSSDIVVKIGNSTNTGDNFVSSSVVSNVSSYFDIYGSFDLDSLYTNYSGFGSSYNAICFEVPNYNLMMYNVSFSFTGFPDMLYRLNYQDSVGNNLVVAQDFTDSYTDLYGFSIVSGLRNSSMWDSSQPIEYCTYSKIVFVGLNIGALNVKNLNFSSSAGYSEGFTQGYNSIKNQTDLIITRLNNQVDSLNSTIDNLHTQISDLQNQLNNSVGWRPLFFAMADTPLKVVSNVLGFELFGLNLFQAFIGIITALAIIWLIRKIWK